MKNLVKLAIRTLIVLLVMLLLFILVGVITKYKILQVIIGILAVILTAKEIKEAINNV